jgi:hypothetical protein
MSSPLAFDANKILKGNIDSLMNTVGTNALCPIIASSYHQIVKVVNAMVGPVDHMLWQIESTLNNNPVIDALGEVNGALDILNSSLGKFNLQVEPSTIQALNIFNKVCLDFNDLMPNAMKGFLDDAMENINEGLADIFTLPDSLSDMMNDAEDMMKSNALSNSLSDITKTILSPVNAYRNFIESSGIISMIKRLQKFERCMTNPNTCNRPVREFWYPGTHKYNSQYYHEMLKVNLKGEVLLGQINSNFKTFEKKMNKTLKNINSFTKSPINL